MPAVTAALAVLARARARPRGLALVGDVWPGGSAGAAPGAVVIGPTGLVERLLAGRLDSVLAALPQDLPVLGRDGSWVGPAVVDAHVHLALAAGSGAVDGRRPRHGRPGAGRARHGASALIGPGLAAVRDLGGPLDVVQRLRTAPPPAASPAGAAWLRRIASGPAGGDGPLVAVAGPMLTAPGGYPSTTWGAGLGVSSSIASPGHARLAVRALAERGVDVVKVALEPTRAGLPTPSRAVLAAVVDAAHSLGLPVVAHALRARMVARALGAGVDELAHTPTERLADDVIERIAASGIAVVSTLQTFFSEGEGSDAAANAAALVRAGVTLRYGTDLGNTGTVSGVDPRELDRLAHAGLGRWGALRAATEGAAGAAGMHGASGRIQIGARAAVVLLDGDPIREPALWRAPLATVLGRSVAALPHAPAVAGESASGRPAAGPPAAPSRLAGLRRRSERA